MASTMSDILDSPNARQHAADLEDYRRRIIEERWLSTLILSVHLEVETMLEVLLGTPGIPESNRKRNMGFAKKLAECQVRNLLDVKIASSIGALNTLRNELAHTLENRPSSDSIYRFIEKMSAMHPLQVSLAIDDTPVSLVSLEDIERHFAGTGAQELEYFVFVSLMLLRARVIVIAKVRARSIPD